MHPLKTNGLKHDFDKASSYSAYSINENSDSVHQDGINFRISPRGAWLTRPEAPLSDTLPTEHDWITQVDTRHFLLPRAYFICLPDHHAPAHVGTDKAITTKNPRHRGSDRVGKLPMIWFVVTPLQVQDSRTKAGVIATGVPLFGEGVPHPGCSLRLRQTSQGARDRLQIRLNVDTAGWMGNFKSR